MSGNGMYIAHLQMPSNNAITSVVTGRLLKSLFSPEPVQLSPACQQQLPPPSNMCVVLHVTS